MLYGKGGPYHLSKTSKQRVNTCNGSIICAVNYLLKFIDVGVACGHRGRQAQNQAFIDKRTKVKFPNGKHNKQPSDAVDLVVFIKGVGYINEHTAPNTYRQYYGFVAGILKTYCTEHGLFFRWGGDWDGDSNFDDQNFDDLVHFEIYKMEAL